MAIQVANEHDYSREDAMELWCAWFRVNPAAVDVHANAAQYFSTKACARHNQLRLMFCPRFSRVPDVSQNITVDQYLIKLVAWNAADEGAGNTSYALQA